ncbi:MAG: hypothetical protein AB7O62_24685 [Pirellulales bacterium]
MSKATYFVQECPTCGRSLEIRVEYLGKKVVCQHCQGKLLASDRPLGMDMSESGILMARAEELLAMADEHLSTTRAPMQARPWA